MQKIRHLPPILINRIAAGEVIEKPASAIKELIENAIDAKASKIEVVVKNGGKSYISVKDNGSGMQRGDLEIATKRHTTSKLPEDDLININSFGFRGEALASIASVARLSISSYDKTLKQGFVKKVEAGKEFAIKPHSINNGTKVEVEDLFFATPARLKFLKSDDSEKRAIVEKVKTLILANPQVSIALTVDEKEIFKPSQSTLNVGDEALKQKMLMVLGKDFLNNCIYIDEKKDYLHLIGYISLPTFNSPYSTDSYIFVNNRPLKDRLISIAVKIGYQDVMVRGRYPIVVLNLSLPSSFVDVNVHPAKSEVRFQDENLVRGFIISAIKNAIFSASNKASSHIEQVAIQKLSTENNLNLKFENKPSDYSKFAEEKTAYVNISKEFKEEIEALPENNLGVALCQIHSSYIISQTQNEFIITDQHAAHERIVYENLKQSFAKKQVQVQSLLIPLVIEFSGQDIEFLLTKELQLKEFGFVFERFGPNAILLKQLPTLMQEYDIKNLFKDMVLDIKNGETINSYNHLLEHILETTACHGSIRFGRKMNLEEMNALLRLIEKTPQSGQCNHGRPTHIKLSLKSLESLFERS